LASEVIEGYVRGRQPLAVHRTTIGNAAHAALHDHYSCVLKEGRARLARGVSFKGIHMCNARGLLVSLTLAVAVTATAARVEAQGRGKGAPGRGSADAGKSKVTKDRALVVTREVLVSRGYDVTRVEDRGDFIIVHYRQGNRGRGRGKGPPGTMIIRRTPERIVFERAPSAVLVDINLRLKL
jgi:hypothetical protein